jgi:hypothetical protein
MQDLLCECDSGYVPVCHLEVMSRTQSRTLHGDERDQGCSVSGGYTCNPVGVISASDADHQREDRHCRLDKTNYQWGKKL